MSSTLLLVVNRTDDRIVLLVPGPDDAARGHAVLGEEEAYCVSSAMRRMAQSREERMLSVGAQESGLRVVRVDHARLPLEIHLDDELGRTVLDLTRDDALAIADMLWGAHRSTATFHAMTSLTGQRRRVEGGREADAFPVPDPADIGLARLVGDVRRRARGEGPQTKT